MPSLRSIFLEALVFICKRTKQFSDPFALLWDLNHSWACSEENVFCVFIVFLWGAWYRVTGTGQALGRLSISSTVNEKLTCVLIPRSVQRILNTLGCKLLFTYCYGFNDCWHQMTLSRAVGSSPRVGRLDWSIDAPEGSEIEARRAIIPRKARKIFFAFIFSYQDGLSWRFRTLKTRKRRFQTICSHRSVVRRGTRE